MIEAKAAVELRFKDNEAAILSRLGVSAAEIAEAHREWEKELAALRASAASEVDSRLAEVIRRESALSLRESATRKHAAEMATHAEEMAALAQE